MMIYVVRWNAGQASFTNRTSAFRLVELFTRIGQPAWVDLA